MYGSPPSTKPPANDLSRPFQMSSGLLRYRSAPSSLIGEVCEDFLPIRSSSPETETMFAGFLSPDLHLHVIRDKNLPPASAGGGVGAVGQRKSQHPPPALPPVQHPAAAAEEDESPNIGFSSAATQVMYNHQHQMMTPSSMAMDSHHQVKDGGNYSNLIRHSSSPAGLFTNLNVENGYGGVIRGIAGYRNGNEGVMEARNASNNNRLKSQISFSSRQSSLMSQISEMENESIGGYTMSSWGDSPILSDNNFASGLKRPRENQTEQTQNVAMRNGLSHQFSSSYSFRIPSLAKSELKEGVLLIQEALLKGSNSGSQRKSACPTRTKQKPLKIPLLMMKQ